MWIRDVSASLACPWEGSRRSPPLRVTTAGHLFHLHWNERPIVTHDDHAACAVEPTRAITSRLFADGVYIELAARGCVTAAHEERHVDALVQGIDRAVAAWVAGSS